jgi:hypothetical protein
MGQPAAKLPHLAVTRLLRHKFDKGLVGVRGHPGPQMRGIATPHRGTPFVV